MDILSAGLGNRMERHSDGFQFELQWAEILVRVRLIRTFLVQMLAQSEAWNRNVFRHFPHVKFRGNTKASRLRWRLGTTAWIATPLRASQ
jgi:hypothetical protein